MAATIPSKEKVDELLAWTEKQGRILTCNSKATSFYTAERGYSFEEEELPHHHLITQTTESAFSNWASNEKIPNPICGVFYRTLFVGGFEHSTDQDEVVFNVQTNTLFIDMRIPRLGQELLKNVTGFDSMSDSQLRLFARRHAFAGYTRLNHEHGRPVCTRHHCIDWNFVGVPRPRPNKWYIEMNSDGNTWKEWAYAKDDFQQHYYWEQWQRSKRDGNGNGLVLALRKVKTKNDDRHGIIVIVGDHFNYILGRHLTGNETEYNQSSTVNLVDEAIKNGDRQTAEAYLSIDGGHGIVSNGCKIDCALQHWKEGTPLADVCFGKTWDVITDKNGISIQGGHYENSIKWDIIESNALCTSDIATVFVSRPCISDEKLNRVLFGTIGKKRDAQPLQK
jgi:hypothetical protein